MAESIPELDFYVFDGVPLSEATLHVPPGCIATYKAANYWREFNEIIEIEPPTAITLPESASVGTGETITLTPVFDPFIAWTTLTWTSEDESIATVSSSGEITGISEGTTTINVTTSNGLNASCQVTVFYQPQDGDVFAAMTEEGVEMKFQVLSVQEQTCSVYGDYDNPSISASTQGSITIPFKTCFYKVVAIGDNAFKSCSNLTSVTIPNEVFGIGESAFEDCSSLTSVNLPCGVTSVEDYAFYGCNSLTSVTAEMETPVTIGKNTFSNRKNATLYVLADSKAAYSAANYWKEFKKIIGYYVPTAITVPSSSLIIVGETITLTPVITPSNATTTLTWVSDDEAIAVVSKAGEVTGVSEGTTTITVTTSNGLSASCQVKVIPQYQDGEVFSVLTEEGVEMKFQVISTQNHTCGVYGTSSEASISKNTEGSITIPDNANGYNVISIGESAFRNCSGMTSVTIPEGVTSIGSYAFLYCSGLTTVTIPNGVTTIGHDAFVYCSGLTSVSIPESVTGIGSSAFRYCGNLVSVTVGMKTPVEIEERTFTNRENATLFVPSGSRDAYLTEDYWKGFKEIVVELLDINLPDSAMYVYVGESFIMPYTLTPIDAITNLTWTSSDETVATVSSSGVVTGVSKGSTTITVTASNGLSASCKVDVYKNIPFADAKVKALCVANWDTNGDGELSKAEAAAVTDLGEVFKSNKKITSFNELQYFTGLTKINDRAFYSCRCLTSVTIPGSVTSIGEWTFCYCSSLTSVTIPNSVTSIGGSAFYGCSSLTSIVVESENTIYDSRDNCNAIIETATNTLIVGCQNTIIPDNVTIIGLNAFYGCSSLTSVTIPNSVISIGIHAFSGCSGLTSVTISNSVTSIGGSAFYGCSGLTSVTIGDSMTSIGSFAFANCSGLTDVYCLAEVVPKTGGSVFSSSINSATLYVPESAIEQYKTTEPWSSFGTIVGLTQDMIDGIEDIEHSPLNIEYSDVEWYDLNGRQIVNGKLSNGKLPKGINIIRHSDGTTRKVLVK